ncbi:MAG: pyridoxal-phosphate dependent enzyme, partial [Candidatus Sumerlaeota bacterium]|nr:pyridoxal-phosphate dependent enzyme [Candidatus Sumerlaeota bacterium]
MKPRTIPLLFDRFPEARGIPWTCLIETATPVRRLERFGGALGGAEVWIKQDSLTSPVYGGNKTRKLEFLLGEAVAKGAKRVMTAGAIGSNHCMATTLHAGRLGMRTSLLLHPQSFVSDHARRQLLAFRYYGADLRWMDDRSQQEERSAEWSRELCEAEGAEPYWIPIGGSTA